MIPTRRLLFLHPGPQPPDVDPEKNALAHLSAHFEGDLLAVWWEKKPEEAARRGRELAPALRRFGYHPTLSYRKAPARKIVSDFLFYVRTGLDLVRRNGRYDAIVAYGVFNTAVAAWVLSRLTRTPYIIDVAGNPWRGHAFERDWLTGVKRRLSRALVPFLVRHAAGLKLLYPSQLDGLEAGEGVPVRVFHNFVPLRRIAGAPPEEPPYVLFIGYPWHLKGVDVLIRAFQRVADRHPAWRLRILGHCPDRAPWEALRAGHPRIEFLKAMKHDRAMELLGRCAIFVLPSRTEAMGRVIVEAMAAGKPVIASAVDGIPHYVRDGDTGLLFASESVDELADRLDRLMSDPAYAAALAARGQAFAHSQLSEARYVEQFRELVEAVTADVPEPVPMPASHGALL